MSPRKRRTREHGRILSVDEETLGTTLAADAAAGATTLAVDDAAEFEDDGSGGWLSINDQQIQYGAVDDDAGTINLRTPLKAAADDGDPVYVWSTLYDTAATMKTALVMVDGDDDNTDPVHATLAEAVQDLPEGLRGEAGESCTLRRVSDDEWEVAAVGGRPSSTKGTGATKFYEDAATVAGPGAQAVVLTHEPIPGSEHLYWEGDFQASSQWSRSGKVMTIPDAAGDLRVGDDLVVKYAYAVGIRPRLIIPLGYPWLYKTGLGASAVYAATDYDDSSWATGPSAFGWREANYSRFTSDFGTFVPSPMDVWTRIHVTTSGGPLSFHVDIDDDATVYIDGTQVATVHVGDTAAADFTVQVGAGAHLIAVYGSDAGSQSSATTEGGYLGVTITEGS